MLGVTACGQNTGPPAPPSGNANTSSTDPRSLALPAGQDARFSVDPPPSLRPDQVEPEGPFANVKPLELKPGGSLGALGLNLKPLLTEGAKNTEDRINRLESAIVAMQEDLKTLAPSMQRMALIENDMNALVTQLEALLQEENMAPVAGDVSLPPPVSAVEASAAPEPPPEQSMPEPLLPEQMVPEEPEPEVETQEPPTATAPPAPVQQTAPGTPVIRGLRLGEHADKTRIVMDVSGPVTYTRDIDNMEKLLVVEMPEASLDGIRDGTFKSPLVKSWSAQPLETGKGVRIILVLSSEAGVIYDHLLGPSPDNPNHRLIIDLKSGAIHSG